MTAPIDQTVMDLLRQSAVGPMLNRPVNDVLKDMGLGPLPELPTELALPELPPLPALDLSLLAKPLTDLASSFGTGQPAAGPGPDPTQVFSQISSVLQTTMQVGSSAVQMAMMLWQGMGATEAAGKATQAQKDGAAVSTQSAQTAAGTATAATSVFTGAAAMAAIMAKYMASVAASAPFLATGAGQAFLLAMTVETLTEATIVVGKTRTELGIESAKMMGTGQKVPVTNAPKGVDPMQIVSQLMQIVPTLTNAVSSGAQSISQAHTALNPVRSIADVDKEKQGLKGGAPAGGAGLVGGGGAGIGAQPRQLTPWGGARVPAGGVGAASASTSAAGTGGVSSASSAGSPMRGGGGMMPMGAAGAAGGGMARAGEAAASDSVRANLVTEQHGNEVVGDIEGASLPVVGAAERVTEPLDGDSPDKALTL
ncbi:hypothetical protein OH799_28640 [Nocardia sp. NBC_00881]|uniref:hypothetical protein n=1 Tax=Nocardia sp. NBC_00881 TaxID=2975995 RepID=UPI00386A5E36|nr:hypothetical protein OH799_28640 [Nocardia sp. NBC_00881]